MLLYLKQGSTNPIESIEYIIAGLIDKQLTLQTLLLDYLYTLADKSIYILEQKYISSLLSAYLLYIYKLIGLSGVSDATKSSTSDVSAALYLKKVPYFYNYNQIYKVLITSKRKHLHGYIRHLIQLLTLFIPKSSRYNHHHVIDNSNDSLSSIYDLLCAETAKLKVNEPAKSNEANNELKNSSSAPQDVPQDVQDVQDFITMISKNQFYQHLFYIKFIIQFLSQIQYQYDEALYIVHYIYKFFHKYMDSIYHDLKKVMYSLAYLHFDCITDDIYIDDDYYIDEILTIGEDVYYKTYQQLTVTELIQQLDILLQKSSYANMIMLFVKGLFNTYDLSDEKYSNWYVNSKKVFDLQYIEAISLDIFTIPYIQGYFGLNGASGTSGSVSSGRKSSSSSSSSLDLLSSPFSNEKGKKKKKSIKQPRIKLAHQIFKKLK